MRLVPGAKRHVAETSEARESARARRRGARRVPAQGGRLALGDPAAPAAEGNIAPRWRVHAATQHAEVRGAAAVHALERRLREQVLAA